MALCRVKAYNANGTYLGGKDADDYHDALDTASEPPMWEGEGLKKVARVTVCEGLEVLAAFHTMDEALAAYLAHGREEG